MSLLNKQAYAMEKDKLVYDTKHPIDATPVKVTITADESGIVKRGQLLDYNDGEYSLHTEGGEASAIVAEDTSYEAKDTEITIVVYISGTFRTSEIIADPDITEVDVEVLRGKGIYLK